MPINYPELLVLLVLHLHCYHSLGFLHSSSGCGFVGKSRADTSSAKHQTSSSTSYLTSNRVSSLPELGGDIIRIRTSPDDDEDSFLSRVGTCLLHMYYNDLSISCALFICNIISLQSFNYILLLFAITYYIIVVKAYQLLQ